MSKVDYKIKFDILAIIIISIFAISFTPITFQNDTYYTIKVGESIFNNGIDMQDHFSWHENLSYTYPHWLYDLVTYIIYSKFGFLGIYISTCLLALILGITIYFTNKKICKNSIIAFFVAVVTIYFVQNFITARAQLVTFILFVLTIYFIEEYLQTKNIKYAVGLIIIPIIIANVHIALFPAYFIFYLPYIAEYIISNIYFNMAILKHEIKGLYKKLDKITKNDVNSKEIQNIKKLIKKDEELLKKKENKVREKNGNFRKITFTKNQNTKNLIIIMIISIFTGFLTPLGTNPYTYLIKTLLGDTTSNIIEHLPTVLINNPYCIVLFLVIIALWLFSDAKMKLSDLFFILGFSFLTLLSRRQFSMLVISSTFIISRMAYYILCNSKKLKESREFTNKEIAFFLFVAISISGFVIANQRFNESFIDKEEYPVYASDYILENMDLKNIKIYNEYEFGSYLLFRGIPVFIDSRADLYDPKFSKKDDNIFMDYIDTLNMRVYYKDTFDKYGITHIITKIDTPLNTAISRSNDKEFKELYSDDNFIIYEILR